MSDRFHDIDALLAEQTADTITIRVFGEDWQLPAALPAIIPLLLARWVADGREADDLTNAECLLFAEALVPGEILDEWKRRGLTVDQLDPIISAIVSEIGLASPGEAAPPATGAPTPAENGSSSTGLSSSPTSPASTGSETSGLS